MSARQSEAPPSAPPGSRFEQALLVVKLVGDLASIPFHLLLFLATRRAQARRLAEDLTESRS